MSAAPTPERPTRGEDVPPVTPAFEERREEAQRDSAREPDEESVQSAA